MLFGINAGVPFRTDAQTLEERSLCRAAQIQHGFAYLVGEHLARESLTQKWLAAQAEMDRTRLGRILNGRVPMRLADIGRITAALDMELPEWPSSSR